VDNYWLQVRQKSYVNHIGKIKMMDELTRQIGEQTIRNGQKNLDNMDANMRSWEATQQSQDRMHTNFVKSIREVENYQDETGKVELSSGYNHAWSRSDGSSFIMSDNPNFDPSSVFQDQRWQEMKKVD
jgi:L-lactate utilization protein LutC